MPASARNSDSAGATSVAHVREPRRQRRRTAARAPAPSQRAASSSACQQRSRRRSRASTHANSSERELAGAARSGAGATHRIGVSRAMPSFSMRRYSAWRLRPSSAAACAITPPARAQRRFDRCRGRARRRRATRGAARGRQAEVGRARCARRAPSSSARCIAFFSSRTLPGQAWRSSARARGVAQRRLPPAGSARPAAGCRRAARPAAARAARSR